MGNDQLPNPITTAFHLVEGYQHLLRSTLSESKLSDNDISHVLEHLDDIGVDNQLFFSLNRAYEPAADSFDEFCRQHLSEDFIRIVHDSAQEDRRIHKLYRHQAEGIESILSGIDTIVATGTGSGKTETFLFPVLNYCLQEQREGVKALIVYPMNALANDQLRRLSELIQAAREAGFDLHYGRFTGQTAQNERDARDKGLDERPLSDGHLVYRDQMRRHPPDVLITNYVMLEHMLTRDEDRAIFTRSSGTLQYLVLDELHTYRGNKAAHLRGLLRRFDRAISRRPVFIGTSATLTDAGAQPLGAPADDGYLSATQRFHVDAFVKPLFDLGPDDTYTLVGPRYVSIVTPANERPIPHFDVENQLGWDLDFDQTNGLQRLSQLTGEKLTEWDLESDDGPPPAYRALAENCFVVALKAALQDRPLSFRDIVELLKPLVPAGGPDPVELAKAYLSAIAFVNHFVEVDALLDFRIHLFLKDLGGNLQSCIRCRCYHSGQQEVCQECGWPLFMVHRGDIHEVVAKVSGHELRRQLRQESDDPKMTYIVRVRLVSEPNVGAETGVLRFDTSATVTDNSIQLAYWQSGGLRIELVPRETYGDAGEFCIPLVAQHKDHQYFVNLVTSILLRQDSDDQKLLGFIDNREQASRYSAILTDALASQYFEALLGLYRDDLAMRSLPTAVAFLMEKLERQSLSESEHDTVQALPAWLSRELSRLPRRDRSSPEQGLFRLEPPHEFGKPQRLEDLTDLQCALLDLFVEERAIDKRFLGQWVPEICGGQHRCADGVRAIKFQRYLVWQHHGIALKGNSASSKQFTSVVLSGQSQIHRQLMERYDEEEVRKAILDLVDDGTSPHLPLIAHCVEDGAEPKHHFYLKADWIRMAPAKLDCRDHRDLRRRWFFTADLHSSDVQSETRATTEKAFHDGKISFLLATPTLEMGVDIGRLKSVLLIGVPPLPSNYAQRAGRAGRSGRGRYALIVSFCSNESNHDRYYFDRPLEMIAGRISPPSFDSKNRQVLLKHLNALVLRHVVDRRETFLAFARRIDEHLPDMADEAEDVFGDLVIDVAGYLRGDFRSSVEGKLADMVEVAAQRPRQLFYDRGVFPDYGFRRDEVAVLDIERAREEGIDLNEAAKRHDTRVFESLRVSGRDPEQAYYKLCPGATVFMAGSAFSIGDDSPFYDEIDSGDDLDVRSYRYLYGRRSDDPSREKEIVRFDRQSWLAPGTAPKSKNLGGLFDVSYCEDATLSLRNLGVVRSDGVERRQSIVGYDLSRTVLIFELPGALCDKPHLMASLLSALDRSIKDSYGLDESELRLMLNVPIEAASDGREQEEAAQTRLHSAVLYDADGNGNAPMRRIFEELDGPNGALQHAYDTLTKCGCTNGCYLCLRSYSTHYHAADVDKGVAIMAIGYLLGRNPFIPDLTPLTLAPDHRVDLAFEVSLSGRQASVQALDREFTEEVGTNQNAALFRTMSRAIGAEHQADDLVLRVVVGPSAEYLAELINGQRLGIHPRPEEKVAFERLLFEMLRFSSVEAVTYKDL